MTHNLPDDSTQRMSDQLAEVIAEALYADEWTEPNAEYGKDWHKRFSGWLAAYGGELAAQAIRQFLIDSPEEAAKELGLDVSWTMPGNHGDILVRLPKKVTE